MAKPAKKPKKKASAASAKLVTFKKAPGGKKHAKTAKNAPVTPVAADAAPETALARITQLEADRTNLMAQVAWARGVAQEQQKALEMERQRAEKLTADLEAQRVRVEQLKALSVLDRLIGRHKRI